MRAVAKISEGMQPFAFRGSPGHKIKQYLRPHPDTFAPAGAVIRALFTLLIIKKDVNIRSI
jgi:hypothetical protein